MARKKNFKTVVIIIVLLAIVSVIYLGMQKTVSETKYTMKANVTELRLNDSKILLGVSNDPNEINFGAVSQNMTVQKFLNFENNDNKDAAIRITKSGDIAPFVSVESDELFLKKGETRQIVVEFNTTEMGYFTGELDVVLTTPKNPSLAFLSLWK